MSVHGSAFPFVSTSASAVSVPRLFALLSSAFPSLSSVSMPLPGLLVPPSVSDVPMLGLSALLFVLFVSDVSVLIPGSLAPPSVSGMPVPGSGLSPPPFLI